MCCAGGYTAYLIQGGLSGGSTNVSGTTVTAISGQSTYVTGGSKPWVSLTGTDGTLGRFYGAVLGQTSTPVVFRRPNEPTHVRVTTAAGKLAFAISWHQNSESADGRV